MNTITRLKQIVLALAFLASVAVVANAAAIAIPRLAVMQSAGV